MSSSVQIDNKGKDILILGAGLIQRLDDTTWTTQAKYNDSKIYQFKARYSERKDVTLCFSNISKDFTSNNMRKAGLKKIVKLFILMLLILTIF